jgi:hypothetical protein
MTPLSSTPREFRTDRMSQELRDVQQKLRGVNGKLAEASRWAVVFAIAEILLAYIASMISLTSGGS